MVIACRKQTECHDFIINQITMAKQMANFTYVEAEGSSGGILIMCDKRLWKGSNVVH